MTAADWLDVKVPVQVKVGPVHLRLFPYKHEHIPPDDHLVRPWCWGAMCRITFRFGDGLVTSKKVQQKYAYQWDQSDRPSDAALAEGRTTVLDNLRTQLARHGFDVPDLDVIEDPDEYDPIPSESRSQP